MAKITTFFLFIVLTRVVVAQQIVGLTCNYRQDSNCIDDLRPRLSWQVQSVRRNQEQSAYQILVASDPSLLASNKGNIWDSKKRMGNQSNYLKFVGLPLQSNSRYYWKVRIWDRQDHVSPWSPVASWQMGLLHPEDWKAKWITASKWFTPVNYRPKGLQLGSKGGWADVDLQKSCSVEQINIWPLDQADFPTRFQILGSDEFNFVHHNILVDQSKADYFCQKNGAQHFKVKGKYRFIRLIIIRSTSKKNTVIRQLEVYSAGKNVALLKFTREYGTAWDYGHAPFLVDGMPSQQEGDVCPINACPSIAAPFFRKSFNLTKKVKQAYLYYAALGMADVEINGNTVGQNVLAPPFTDYYKRIMYSGYDVTSMISTGENVIGILLGNGFFSPPSLGFGQRQNGNGPPQVLAQILITFTDGTTCLVATGQDWKWSRSEVTFNDVWEGYSEDRSLAKPGWSSPGYSEVNWLPVQLGPGLPGKLVARFGPENRVNGFIKPDSVKGNHAYFKTASVGWPRLRINGRAGQIVRITGSGPGYRVAPLSFKLASDGLTNLSPRFIIQPGATDIEIEGLEQPLSEQDIDIQYVNADLKITGDFNCSNPFLNKLFEVTMRTHRNYINDFPADPNREKQGWTQDVQNMFNTAAYFTDVRDLYWRWWNDMKDNQDEQGYLGSVLPMVNRQVYDWNSPWWSGMIVFLPWEHYQYYGDKRILQDGYIPMRKYVNLLEKIANNGEGRNWNDYAYFTQNLDKSAAREKMIIWNGAGDWNNPYTKTQHAVPTPITTMTAWFYYASILSKTAHILGHKKDENKYKALAEQIKNRFNRKYFHAENGLYGDSINNQTAQILPLAIGMVPDAKSGLTYQRLLDAIHQREDHVGTGFTSISFLMQTLASHRESALANKIVNQKDYPSWNTLIKGGVMREDWHGNGAQMPSCGGALGAWIFQSVLGIQPKREYPGFKEFILAPQPDQQTGLTQAKGYYNSLYGSIIVDWCCEENKFKINLKIPFNTRAQVVLPVDHGGLVTLDGQILQVKDPRFHLAYSTGKVTFYLGSGEYHLESAFLLK